MATHPRDFPQPLRTSEAVDFLEAILSAPYFRVLGTTERHWVGLRALVTELGELSGNFFFDIHTVALMREHGIRRIASADSDFAKFSGLEIINPIRQERIR
jgi:predicted nucleic acid-binding protein